MTTDDTLITLEQAAEASGISVRSIQRAIALGEIKVLLIGPHQRRIRKSALSAWWNLRDRNNRQALKAALSELIEKDLDERNE
jgi:excisionase family DNA binding protein